MPPVQNYILLMCNFKCRIVLEEFLKKLRKAFTASAST